MHARRLGFAWKVLALPALLLAAGALIPAGALAQEPAFTAEFRLGDCRFSSRGENPLFPLRPGYHQRLEGESDGEEIVVEVNVLHKTRTIDLEIDGEPARVRTRVVEEREYVDGEIAEISLNYFARCRPTNDVFYFGEDVDIFEGDEVSHEGSWLAGRDGATPGLIMPGTFLLGARYLQEVAPGVATDRAEHVDMGVEVEVPAGEFTDCVEIVDTNPLDPESEGDSKIYCPGLGLTVDEEIELVDFGRRGRELRD